MAENSGGPKDIEKKKIEFSEVFSQKNRSQSLGSTNFSRDEINKIIFGQDKKSPADPINTQSGKQRFINKDKAEDIKDNNRYTQGNLNKFG